MEERLVQWTLLKDISFLAKIIGKPIVRQIAANYTTDKGVIDFILETKDDIMVVELETVVDNKAKLSYCIDQVKEYTQVKYNVSKPVRFAIVYEKSTPQTYITKLQSFANQFNIILKTYSLFDVQEIYKELLERLQKTSGLYLGSPVAMDITHLRYLNKIIQPFWQTGKKELPQNRLRGIFKSNTNYGVYKRLAEDFEIMLFQKSLVRLTQFGEEFVKAYNPDLLGTGATMPDLSKEQKRVLLQVLTNGKFTKCKVNIYYFLRFVHLTEGDWLPKPQTPEVREKLEFINNHLRTSYRWSTASELLAFTCNQCEELELVFRMKIKGRFDKVMLTQLGSRVLGFIELYLHLKREQIQIPIAL